jgi:glycerophosphoryl diester phosphodiesterase
MLIISHRGYHVSAAENTLESFEAAVAMGVDGIETDIRLTADQVPILLHDHLTPDGREVAALSHAEIIRTVGYPVPTLEQALQLRPKAKPEFLWNLEIKVPAAVEQTIALVKRYSADSRILITSFGHPVIDEVSRRTDVECGLLVAHRPLAFNSRPDWIPNRPHVNTVVWYWETVDDELIASSAACGLRNYVYGVTTPAEHQRLANWDLEGVITDRPEYLIRRTGF